MVPSPELATMDWLFSSSIELNIGIDLTYCYLQCPQILIASFQAPSAGPEVKRGGPEVYSGKLPSLCTLAGLQSFLQLEKNPCINGISFKSNKVNRLLCQPAIHVFEVVHLEITRS